jgi:flagellar motor switch protein FliN/FliY
MSSTSPDSHIQDNLAALMNVQLPVSIRFGETEMLLEDVIGLSVGSVIELSSTVDDPVELIVNGRRFARGQVVSVDGFYGIRITEINKSRRAGDALYTDTPDPNTPASE